MLKQIKEVQDAWRATQRTLDIKVVVNGKTYEATDINSLKYDSGAYTGDTFSIGSTYSNNVQIEFSHLVEGLKLGMEVRPSIGIKTSKGYIYEPLGVFIISSEIKMDRNNNLTSISASDRFCGLEGTYKSKLVYPAKVLDIIAEICAQSGVKANADDLARLPHQADLPIPISGQSYRKALGWIAQLYAGYATFDRQGLFTIRTIAEPNYELDPSQYEQAGLTKNEAPYKISGIQCQTVITTKTRDGENTEETKTYQVGNTSGSQIKLENNIMTPDRLNNIWEQIKDISFYPFSLNWFGNPAIEAGDWLKLQDKQGNKFIVPNNSYTLDFNGGLSATSKADQTSSTDSAISWRGTYAQIIEELQARKAPDGTVIFPPSVAEPPKNAKPNDVWFKQNGNSTELWVFTAQEDGSEKWIRRDLTPDEIKKQVQETQSGLNDAKKQIADNLAKADGDIAELNANIREQKKAFDTDIDELNASIRDQKGTIDTDIDELNASIRDQKGTIDGLSTTINTVAIPKITDVTNKVSDALTKINDQKNIVTGLQTQSAQQGKDISKITTDIHGVSVDLANLNGDVNQTKVTVQGLQSTLGNAKGDIAQIKVDAKRLETSLSGKVDNSTYANFVNQTNQALNAKLVASDLNGYAKTTDVQATANGLQLNINSVSGKLDNLVIGNRNLVRNSGFPKNADYWSGVERATHDFYYTKKQPLFLIKANTAEEKLGNSAYFSLKRNTNYVVSFKGFASDNVSSYDIFILARKYGETNSYSSIKHLVDAKRLSGSSVQYVKDLVFNSGENDEAYFRIDNNGSSNGKDAWLFFTEVKVEEGNKSTAWTAAPEDEQDRINGITSQLSARITANSQQFSSYYSKTDINNKISGVQSQITQNAAGLQSVVAKVDNIRIGGTNLIRDSAMFVNSHESWQDDGTIAWHDGGVEVIKGDLIQKIPAKPNTTYTFSFGLLFQDMKDPWANQFFFLEYKDEQFTKTTNTYVDHRWAGDQFPNTSGRKDKKLTFTTQPDCTGLKMYIRQESDRNKPFYIFKPKLEEGNQATDWSPSPEDKANQSDFSALNQTVKGIQSTVSSNYGNLQSQISQTAGDIRNEVTSKVNGIQSQINQNAAGLQSVVAKVDNIRIGGTNLIRNSNFDTNLRGIWYTNGNYPVVWQSPGVGLPKGDLIQNIPAKPNTTYTFSFDLWYQDVTEKWGNQFFFVEHKDSECTKTTNTYVDHRWAGDQFPNTFGRKDKKLTFTTQPDCYGLKMYIRQESNKNQTFRIAKPKLEEGNQATDWSPAPEDKANQSDYSALNQTVKGIQSTVSSNYGNLQSQISQTAGTISTVVGKVNNLEIATNVQIVDHGIDLNTYKSTGTWFVKGSGTNAPASNWFYLDVKTAWDGRIVQIWQSDDVPTDRYVRTYIDDHWSNWERSASYSEYSTLNQTVKGLQSTVSSNYGNLQSQISQTAGTIRDEVTNKISGVQSQIDQTVKGLQSTVSSNYGNLQSQINQTAGTIRNEVTNKVNGIQSQINQNATGLQSVVAKVDNIRIGGTNLIRNSNFDTNLRGIWYTNGNYPVVWQSPGVGLPKGDLIQNIPAKPNTTYTFSFDLWYQDVTPEKWGNQFFFVEHKDSECTKTTNTYVDHRWAGDQFPNTAGRKDKKLTFTTQPDCYGLKMYIRQESNKNQTFRIAKPKLEEGNQATDWSPAPEDKANQSDYSALNQTVKGLQSTVSSNYGNLQSQISQTAGNIRNEVTDKISGVQSQITQNVNNLNLRLNNVSRNLVLNSGNFQDLHGWYTGTNGALTLGKHDFWKNGSENVLWINNPSKTNEVTVNSARFDVVPHTTYTISFYAFASANVTSSDLYFLGRKKSSNNDFDYVINPIALRRYSPSQAEYIVVTINTGESEEGYLRFDNNGSTDGNGNLLGITDIQMEEGSVATPWKPATSDQVLAQINVAAGTTLIQNDKIYMDASSTVFSGKAFIPDAAITNISADKINTGTLDAGRINVINLNANNITTGTINGANLKIDLNSGEILFQKGRIASTNGNLNIDLDNGRMSVTNWMNQGVYFENGNLVFDDQAPWLTSDNDPKYGGIKRADWSTFAGSNGLELYAQNGVVLKSKNYNGALDSGTALNSATAGSALGLNKDGEIFLESTNFMTLVGGNKFDLFGTDLYQAFNSPPSISIGTGAWGGNDAVKKGSRILIEASYVHVPSTYYRTTGSAPNVYVANDGALVRSTSASKYKTEIKRSYSTEYGEKLLNLPTAIWTDKGQKERYEAGKRHIKPERYFGMIAEDLADAGLDLLVSRNPLTHEIEGIQYERIAPALLPVIKKLKDKVNELEKK